MATTADAASIATAMIMAGAGTIADVIMTVIASSAVGNVDSEASVAVKASAAMAASVAANFTVEQRRAAAMDSEVVKASAGVADFMAAANFTVEQPRAAAMDSETVKASAGIADFMAAGVRVAVADSAVDDLTAADLTAAVAGN